MDRGTTENPPSRVGRLFGDVAGERGIGERSSHGRILKRRRVPPGSALDSHHPALLERRDDEILDSWIFAGGRELIDCVWRAGERVVRGGRHRARDALIARYGRALHELRA